MTHSMSWHWLQGPENIFTKMAARPPQIAMSVLHMVLQYFDNAALKDITSG